MISTGRHPDFTITLSLFASITSKSLWPLFIFSYNQRLLFEFKELCCCANKKRSDSTIRSTIEFETDFEQEIRLTQKEDEQQ